MSGSISVVIPTHNRRSTLLRLIESLAAQNYPADRLEVIVVADGCEDDTVRALAAATFPFAVRVLEQTPARGPGAARNSGASHASGKTLLFIDDDIEPFPTMLELHARAHAECDELALIGAPVPVRNEPASFQRIAAWAWWEQQFERMSSPGYRFLYSDFFTGVFSVSTALYRRVGGFDDFFAECHEDSELGLRILQSGARVLFAREAGGMHHEVRDLNQLLDRKRAEGKADVRLATRYPELYWTLRVSNRQPPRWSTYGIVRRAACSPTRLSGALVGLAGRALTVLEKLRARRAWELVQGGMLYFGYWRGAALEAGGVEGLEALAQAQNAALLRAPRIAELDLAHGIAAAERTLDEQRPDALRLRLHDSPIGDIPATSGAEQLRGAHLRRILANHLASEVLWTIVQPLARRWATGEWSVSIILPSYNSARTIARTLDSLLAQTFRDWEAIVVDDGSTDASVAIASEFAARDPRIVVHSEAHRGASHARNKGLARARNPWIYFLDSDDWIDPQTLEYLTDALKADPELDAVHCGWAVVAPDGTVIEEARCNATGDLFPMIARRSAFAIHACLVSRDFVQRAGGFDPTIRISQDWVLWQRVARAGARFGAVPKTLAYYRKHPDSLSADPVPLFDEAMRIIELGHGPDARIREGLHGAGRPADELTGAKLNFLCWVAGMMIARGLEPELLLSRIEDGVAELDAKDAAESIFRSVPAALARTHSIWGDEWERFGPSAARFLGALEAHMNARGFASSAAHELARHVLDEQVIGAVHPHGQVASLNGVGAVRIEATAAVPEIAANVERLRVHVEVLGTRLAVVELPVFNGLLPAVVVRDAIADRFAWQILREFFERRIYTSCDFRADGELYSAWWGDKCIARDLPAEPTARLGALHDAAGWQLFLEEVWNSERGPSLPTGNSDDAVFVEVSAPCPDLQGGIETRVALTIGGSPLAVFPVQLPQGCLPPAQLRQTLTDAAGFELCKVAVREALVGESWEDTRSLRERLAARNAARQSAGEIDPVMAAHAENEGRLVPGWKHVAAEATGNTAFTLIAQRAGPIGGSAARFARLPTSVAAPLFEVERRSATPIIAASNRDILYAPTLVTCPRPGLADRATTAEEAHNSVRHDFESLFARGANPWHYDSAYERRKYQQTLSLVPDRPIARALELACAEGHFTEHLAPRVERLVAADISEIALGRAAERLSGNRNVEFIALDLTRDALPGQFDLIVCSEVLYYVRDKDVLRATAQKIAGALAPGGLFVTAHARVANDEPDHTGYDWDVPFGVSTIFATFADTPPLRLVRELRTPLYRVAAFEAAPTASTTPVVTESVAFDMPEPEIAAHIIWNGTGKTVVSTTRQSVASLGAQHMPILMYHHVAPDGPNAHARYRIHPGAFEAQLRYLQACGFTSVTLNDWRRRVDARSAHPPRPVLLTFDDGYVDFAEYAWPLLQQYGFGALLFVVTGRAGGSNSWDRGAEEDRLLDWSALRRLANEGVRIGSHSDTHPRMSALAPDLIAREAVESRAILERELGRVVDSFAYPWGDEDEVVRHLTGAAGYDYGLSCRSALARRGDAWLALPRIEVMGSDDLPRFIAKLVP